MIKSLALLALAPLASAFGESRFLQDDSNCTSLMEALCENDGEYPTSNVCDVLGLSGIPDQLAAVPFTFFAPIDDAFEAIPASLLTAILEDPQGLDDLLGFHTVYGQALESTDLICDGRLFMYTEFETEASVTICEGDRIYQVGVGNPTSDWPEITTADIETCNGVIHLVDGVMLPEPLGTAPPTPSPTVPGTILGTPFQEPVSEVPSDGPSLAPSVAPSDGPSLQPSDGPSMGPSNVPSDGPSLHPSDGPSLQPSDGPSLQPSDGPSLQPSDGPSLQPSDGPSLQPSDGPSMEPSAVPSDGPSLQPSDGPSMEPSFVPTDGPSNEPSVVPSVAPTETPTVVPTPAPTPEPTKLPVSCSTADIACNSVGFTHLCAAITAVGFDESLGDYNSTFTVFAPNDEAFEKLGDAALEYLMDPDNSDVLTNILAFHAVEGDFIFSDELECSELLEMANGKDTRTVCKDEGTYQKGKGNSNDARPEIIATDIESCNGIIHVIDGVMLYDYPDELGLPSPDAPVAGTYGIPDDSPEEPVEETSDETPADEMPSAPKEGEPSEPEEEPEVLDPEAEEPEYEEPEEEDPEAEEPEEEEPEEEEPLDDDSSACNTVDQVVCEDPNFSILCGSLEITGIADALSDGNWTLFAPNNEAFLKLPPDYVQTITADSGVNDMTKLLLFHAVQDEVYYSDDLPCVAGENLIGMANGKDSRTLCRDITPGVPVPRYQKGKYNTDDKLPAFARTDMEACNGVVHELDRVLLFKEIASSEEKDRKTMEP